MDYKKVLMEAVNAVLPPACPMCGKPAPFVGGIRADICGSCMHNINYVSEPACLKCGKPVKDEETEYCSDCSRQKHVYDQACALYEYSKNVKESIYRFKYYNKQEYAGIYANQMADRCGRMIRMWSPDVIIPVPIHISKYKERGFNQAGLIAQALGRAMQIPADEEYLVRIVKTQPMKELSNRERIKNLQNAFQVREKVVRYRKVLIVDDIYTTGATFDACAAVLKDAGVSLYSGVRTRKAVSVRKRQTEVVPRSYIALCQIHFWQRAFFVSSAPKTGGFFHDAVRRTESPRSGSPDYR